MFCISYIKVDNSAITSGGRSLKREHDVASVHELASDADGKDEWVLVNPRILVGLVGAVACFAWLFLMIGTTAFIPLVDFESGIVGVSHLCFVIGVSVALTMTWGLSDWFSIHRKIQYVMAAVCSAAGVLGLLMFATDWTFLAASSAVLGCGFGLLYSLYGEFICLYFHTSIRTYVLGIFCLAFVACAGLLFTGPQMSFFFALLFPAVAFVAYGCVMVFFRLDKHAIVDHETSDKRNRVVWRSYLATATAGMAAGFGLGFLLSNEALPSFPYVIVEVFVVGTSLFLLVDAWRWHLVNETVTMRFFLPCAAVVAFPLMFVPQSIKFVFAVLLVCGSLFPITCSLSAICRHIALCDLSPIRVFSFGRLICLIGVVLGMALAFFGFTHGGVDGHVDQTTSAGVVVVFMVLVIFSASFVMTEDNYPDDVHVGQIGSSSANDSSGVGSCGGIPIRKLEAEEQKQESRAAGDEHVGHPGMFHVKCELVARTYGLSNRQREVLGMLAKGRNADYITEKLVISSHTAKAHIYNIYQKTGVHSRQELMDLVENTDVSQAGDMLQDVLRTQQEDRKNGM